jgi:hypothetical protein
MKAARPSLALPALAATALLAACSPAAKAPPAPRPAPAQTRPIPARPAPAAVLPVQPGTRWMDMPRSPGEWRYAAQDARSEASFRSPSGAPLARLACLAGSRTVVLSLPESGAPRPVVTIRTETASRALEARRGDRDMSIAFASGDPLLDAMALSKGTFALEADGLPSLYLPSWAEVSRVIEDCR